jgi:quinol monooxygenase YgiN
MSSSQIGMNENVYWVLELAVQPARLHDFSSLMQDMVAAARTNEPGTLNYEWNINDDGAVCHIYVRYENSAAVMLHMAAFGTKFTGRFMALVQTTRFVVYGAPSAEVKTALAPYGAVYLAPFGGFKR